MRAYVLIGTVVDTIVDVYIRVTDPFICAVSRAAREPCLCPAGVDVRASSADVDVYMQVVIRPMPPKSRFVSPPT